MYPLASPMCPPILGMIGSTMDVPHVPKMLSSFGVCNRVVNTPTHVKVEKIEGTRVSNPIDFPMLQI
jgi:hypothetical protein